jgi:DNA polymerase-1
MDKSVKDARDHGFVETIKGRRRVLNDINSRNAVVRGFAERNAINAPIQGAAADIIKIAMINIQDRMKAEDLKSKMLLQVHDELIFDVLPSELDKMKDLVKTEMEGAVSMSVPLEVEASLGENWLQAH